MARVFTANLTRASGSKWGELRLDITPGTPNTTNNTTPITYELYIQRTATTFGNYYSGYNASKASLTINGTAITISDFSYDFRTNYKKSVKTGSMTITHNDNGTKSVSASASVTMSGEVPNGSGSGSLTLTTIARASTFTLGGATSTNADVSVSISRKSSSFTHEVKWRVGSGSWITASSSAGTSASFKVQPSNMANLKSATITVSVQTKNGTTNIGSAATATRTITIPNSTISVSGTANTGSAQTVSITNSGGTLTYTRSWALGNATGGNVASWTPAHSALPNATSGTLTCTVTTKNGTATINTTSATRTITVPASVVPTISSITHSEQDSTTAGLSLGKYVQGKSKIKIGVNASAGSGASITGYTIKVDGQTATSNNSTTGVIKGSGTLAITATITDSRGRSSSTASQNITVLPYTQPYLTGASAYRTTSSGANDPFGTYSRATFKMNATSLDSKNTLAYEVLTSEASGANSTSRVNVGHSASNIGKTITTSVYSNFTRTIEYQYTVILKDKYGTYTFKPDALYIPTAGVNLAIGHGGIASSFGKLASYGTKYDLEIGEKGLSVDGPLVVNGSDVTVNLNLSSQVQNSSYRYSVIALCELTNTNPSFNSYSNGVLTFHRTNSLAGEVKVDIGIAKKYNTTKPNVIMSSLAVNTGVAPCTFTYNGVKYGGVRVYINDAEFNDVHFYGVTNFKIFGLDYYQHNTSTVLNAEVNSSINLNDHFYTGTFYFQNWAVWHAGNLSGSNRGIKKDIEKTNHQENFEIFKGLKVYDYNLIDESDEKKTREKDHIGLITDEVPDFLTDKDQSHIKLYDLLSLTVSTLQTTIKKVEALELQVKDLENENGELKGGNQ